MFKKQIKKIYVIMLLFCFVLGTFTGCKSISEPESSTNASNVTSNPSQSVQTVADPTKLRILVPGG